MLVFVVWAVLGWHFAVVISANGQLHACALVPKTCFFFRRPFRKNVWVAVLRISVLLRVSSPWKPHDAGLSLLYEINVSIDTPAGKESTQGMLMQERW